LAKPRCSSVFSKGTTGESGKGRTFSGVGTLCILYGGGEVGNKQTKPSLVDGLHNCKPLSSFVCLGLLLVRFFLRLYFSLGGAGGGGGEALLRRSPSLIEDLV